MKRVLSVIIIIILCFCLTACGDKIKPTTTPSSSTPSSSTPSQTSTDDTKKAENNNIILAVNPSRLVQDEAASVKAPTGKINANLQKRVLNGEIVKLKDGDCLDLNDDGIGEVIHLSISSGSSEMDKIYLTIGNRKIVKSADNITNEFYAGMLSGKSYRGIQILVYQEGPSSDPYSHIFHYQENHICDIGGVKSHPDEMKITQDGFTATTRGRKLQYFTRPASYIISFVSTLNSGLEGSYYSPYVVEVPKDMYPIGTIVKLKQDLILQATRDTANQTFTIPKDTLVSITATDDVKWLYITPYDTVQIPYEFSDGAWLEIKSGTFDTCIMNGKEISGMDLFDGLFNAD